MKTRILSFFLALCMIISMVPAVAVPAKAATVLPSEIYLKQLESDTCTLSSAAMMFRARLYLSGNDSWKVLNETTIRSVAWVDGAGIRWNWSYSFDGNSLSVARADVSGISVAALKSAVDAHPEGIVFHVVADSVQHAVLITDYEGDTFYCADPASGYSGKRISLAASYLGKCLGSQSNILGEASAYWYISSYSIQPMEYENLGENFTAHLTHDASGLGIYNAQPNVELGTANVTASEWKFVRQSDGSYKLLSVLDDKALDVQEAKTTNHTNVQTYAENDTAAQRWFIRKQGTGYVLISACSGKALDVAQGTASSTAGTNVQIYDINNSRSQIMRITRSDSSTDYLSQCTFYPSYATLSIQNSTTLKTLPCSAGTDSNSKDVITLSSGTVVAEGLYENTAGNYWYLVNYNGTTCYLYSGDATPTATYSGLYASGITAPSSLNEGSAFALAGTINSSMMPIRAVRAYIKDASGATVLYTYDLPEENEYSYSLAGSAINNGMTFDTLSAGEYQYVLVAEVRNYRAIDNELSYVTCQETLNDSGFTVVGTADTITITFDPNGGSCNESTRVINAGGTLTNLPVATRSGYVFEGWATKLGLIVCEGDTVYTDYTFYAQWSTDYENLGDSFTAYLTHAASGLGITNALPNVELGESNTGASEWEFIRQSDGSYKILSVISLKALDVYDAGTANWTNVWTYEDNGTLAQRWYIREVDGGYILISACSGKALDVYYGSASSVAGDNVQIYTVNNSAAQIMRITRTSALLNGWVQENGAWHYYQDGQKVTGWLKDGNYWYYLDSIGAMTTGWVKVGGNWFYMNKSGVMQTGWQQINSKWYYFATGGAMQTGWLKDGSCWYYLDSTGAMTTGWVKVSSNWFYMNKSGVMQTGWQKINGYWYYFASGGAMQTGWVSIGGKWYYFASGGAMQTGWQQINGKWYYFASGGAMQTGWLYLDGYWYYLDATGAMVTGTQVINGKTYVFNKSGVWIG